MKTFYRFIRLISIPVIAVLLLFNLRRLFFSLVVFLPKPHRTSEKPDFLPEVLILAACRNEKRMISGLCQALRGLDYPAGRYQVCLIDDGSSDGTRQLMEQYAEGQAGWQVLSMPVNVGKASALNAALRRCTFGKIIYVFDADHRPNPDVLKRAVRYFDDPLVAGVSGLTIPSNPLASPSAYYSTVENQVHRLITMRAKDRFGLAPALLGSNCGYRRSVLHACGGFRDGALLEDSDLTLAFYRAGYRVRFAQDVEATHQVPETVRGYLNQHRRWARGFTDVANQQSAGLIQDRRLPLPLRIELFLFSAGYLDRITLAGAVALSLLSLRNPQNFQLIRQVIVLSILTPLIQVFVVFVEQRMSVSMWIRLPLIPFFYVLDMLAAGLGMLDFLFGGERIWNKTERSFGQ